MKNLVDRLKAKHGRLETQPRLIARPVNQHFGFSEGKMTPINICGKIPLSCWLTNTK